MHGLRVFPEGAIPMRTELAVNPDGTAASYVPGDQGCTYVANGVNLMDKGKKRNCLDNFSLCRKKMERSGDRRFRDGLTGILEHLTEAISSGSASHQK